MFEQILDINSDFIKKQKNLLTYSFAISIFSPIASSYQLSKLYKLPISYPFILKESVKIIPHQTCLKICQMNASTPVKDYCNPWIAFGCVGILQGVVYGQANIHFSKVFKIGSTLALKGMFRGSLFGASRDMLSQGIPFMLSDKFRINVLDNICKDNDENITIKQYGSVITTSIGATYMSQLFHNFQIKMHTDHNISYVNTVKDVWKNHGIKTLWKGAEARIGLLLIVNILNEALLKPVWT